MATAEPLSAALLSADIASPDTMSADAMSPHAVAPPDGCRTHTYDDAQAEAHSEGPGRRPAHPHRIRPAGDAPSRGRRVARRGRPGQAARPGGGLALPTAYHLLRTLAHEGYLRKEKGLFVLGAAAERLSSSGAQQNRRGMITDALQHWRDAIGVPVYFSVYREGEIEVVAVADTPGNPAVAEWADFRETGHAHAIGQCLLAQLDDESRRDHLDRYPAHSITPYTVRDDRALLRRLNGQGRMQPVVERQEYALGTVCAAFPITVGSTAATMAVSSRPIRPDVCCPRPASCRTKSGNSWGHSPSLSASENSLLVIPHVR